MYELWYTSPAHHWEEALPLGNGRLGGMVFGGVAEERVALNEDTLWSGTAKKTMPQNARDTVEAARAHLADGDIMAAERTLEKGALGPFTQCYLPLGDLRLSFPDLAGETVSEYKRSLSLDGAMAETRFTARGARHVRTAFVSASEQALFIRLTTSGEEGVRVRVRLDCQLVHSFDVNLNDLIMNVECPTVCEPNYVSSANPVRYSESKTVKGMRACVRVRAVFRGGTARTDEDGITIDGAHSVVLMLTARTNFMGYNQPTRGGTLYAAERALSDLTSAASLTYEDAARRHVSKHQSFFSRVSLHIGGARAEELPTDLRLKAMEAGGDDAGLYELLFQYGRYLLICSSRPGTRAANLQGIWNELLRAPWSSNYTVNINTEMNYWPAEVCALPEMGEPLFDLIDAITARGEGVAAALFGARGSVCGHNSDIWGHASPVGAGREGSCCWGWWTMAHAWLTAHLYAHYLYSGDQTFLRDRALPCLRAAARFVLDTLQPDERGCLSMPMQTSPENNYMLRGEKAHLARRTTMSDAIAYETLENYIDALTTLGSGEPDLAPARAALARMSPYEIGPDGRLLEWDEQREEAEITHRHLSHLYGLFPGRQITRDTPELLRAARASLDTRGDEGTGWSLGWKINLRARLGEGDHALKLIRRQLRPVEPKNEHGVGGTYPNMMDAHPPFQIDGNFGASSGIARMLADSVGQDVYLLGALPASFTQVTCGGLRVAGGYTVSLQVDGARKTATLRCECDTPLPVRVHFCGQTVTLCLEKGQSQTLVSE